MRLSLAPVSSPQWRKRAMIRGRGKRRRGWVAPEIPWEIEMEILIRLPAKSLTRFLCVSKLWLSLIRSRYFTNRYRLTVASTPRLYMSLVDQLDPPSSTVVTRESVLLSLSSSSSSSEYLSPDLFFPGMGGHNMVAIRGFILYHVPGEAEAYIYNPTTGQFITLATIIPSISAEKGFLKHYLFGYDPVLDQYKVVCTFLLASRKLKWITSLEHWVLVLEPGGSWKKMEFDGQPHRPTRLGLCINGVAYYLASTCMSRDIVVSFDVRSEEFNMTQAPVDVVSAHGKPVGFIEYGGKPAIFDHTNLVPMGLMDLWVLEDGGRWSRKSLALKPCQMHLVDNNTRLIAHGTTRDGEVILAPFPLLSPYYILYYDVQKNDLRKVGIGGIPDHWFSNPDLKTFMYLTQLDTSESIIYLEI